MKAKRKKQKTKTKKIKKETWWRRGRQGEREGKRESETQRQKAQPYEYKGAFLLSGLKSSHKKGIPKISNGNNEKYYFK